MLEEESMGSCAVSDSDSRTEPSTKISSTTIFGVNEPGVASSKSR